MVFVPDLLSQASEQGMLDVESWLASLDKQFTPEEVALIRKSADFAAPRYARHHEITAVPVLHHVLGVASILAGMGMDAETIAATVLHACPEHLPEWKAKLQEAFSSQIVALVEGIARMEQIQGFSRPDIGHAKDRKKDGEAQQAQVESLRKMLLAMVEDIRVVLIKLADRVETLRSLAGAPEEEQQRIAHEAKTIFAPLANRLGIWHIKWELEDLSLRFLEPKLYKEVAKLLAEKRVGREQYIKEVLDVLQQQLQSAGIQAEVMGRPKHIYSIVNKMRRKQLSFNELYDVRAVRILVDDIKDCYAALGLIHNLWQPIPKEFDDYIARPKSNNYRSLHTVVIGPRNLPLEIQIRTHEMHHHSELGVAAHWRYKEGGKADSKFDDKIVWLRQILEWKQDVSDDGGAIGQFKNELFQDKVYVLTPQGKVVDLPRGATPVDFAYILHTDLGHRTRGAKVDGSIVPLNYKLQNGQRVEILAAKQGAPSRDWLNPNLGYLQSSRARAKVRHWFRYQNFEEDAAQGRLRLDKELHRLGAVDINLEKISQKLHFPKLEELLAAIGRGEVGEHQITQAVQSELPAKPEQDVPFLLKSESDTDSSGVLVEGVGNLMTYMAKCCKPAPPDAIIGYVTRGRGVTIHRQACPFIKRLPEEKHGRLLATQWGNRQEKLAGVDIDIEAYDRQGLLRDISDLFARERVNVTQVKTQSRNNQARMSFSIEIADLDQLTRLLALLRQVPSVNLAKRHL
ncbi:bifunctional (p)ppGpp synthetase/guanosine-3',5'-bis(diphosphate) 3'-pyrophosphohydrolase [Methylobacillus flagellatus]|uniref:RelA/SpoT family protein n=1 Tax=Methylobacillus flagellatus TaxID=405 RepID=UPI002853C148|nr:bifunctional (p)ppGpp synthetase/guanosine-3',5'-bis(diphosphate) 3'-pyrophosphohydrolase [Methylobacillus flagellatus]MDR5171251.1 bifunctional (p)ppGpp synthetase/guanosine-3',5'-bis(diphosphate) 3'-pyrophosphohydrolase [Methylobacillus flagellatus]